MSHLYESCVIDISVDSVWEVLSPFDFKFWDIVSKVESNAENGAEGSVSTVTFADGNVQVYKVTKHDKQNHELRYCVLDSKVPLPAPVVEYTIHLRPVTHLNHTFVEFLTDFSTDISLKEYVDHKFKHRAFFGALKEHLVRWTCAQCTFLNTEGWSMKCAMCAQERAIPDNRYYRVGVPIEHSRFVQGDNFETPPFTVAGHTWQLIVFPKEKDNHVSVFLKILDLTPQTPRLNCNFKLNFLHPSDKKMERPHSSYHMFVDDEMDRGFTNLLLVNDIIYFVNERQELVVEVAVAPLPPVQNHPPPYDHRMDDYD